MIIYLLLALIMFIILKQSKTISPDIYESYIFGNEFNSKYKFSSKLFLSLIWPYTLIKLTTLQTKYNFKNMKTWIITGVVLLVLALTLGSVVPKATNYYNQSVNLELQFNRTMSKRVVTLDNVTKVIHQKLQIAKINDSSYYKNLYVIASNRADAPNLFMKWVTENNPNVNYSEVSSLYKDLSASVESYRANLVGVESELQNITYQYDVLHREFPSNIYLFYGKQHLDYKPISTDSNRIINETGIDNNINIQ